MIEGSSQMVQNWIISYGEKLTDLKEVYDAFCSAYSYDIIFYILNLNFFYSNTNKY